MKLALVIHGLGAGGAERVLTMLANTWAARGEAVTFVTFDDGSMPPAYELHPAIGRRALAVSGASRNAVQAVTGNAARVRKLRAALFGEKPDAVISFVTETNVTTLLAALGAPFPVIVSERVDPSAHRLPAAWRALRAVTYRTADAVVVQGERIARGLPRGLRSRAHVIPNPVQRPAGPNGNPGKDGVHAAAGRKLIVGLGRLVAQKGFDILVRAFARVADRHPDWDVVIWGEGAERASLEALIVETGLEGRVKLPGVTKRAAAAYEAADVFVLPSRYEGFPNALAEAMACGRPVIAADCPSGPAEIVRDGVDGLLVSVEDEAELAAALERLMRDEALREALAARAGEVTSRYSVERIVKQWDDLIGTLGVRP